MNRLSIAAACLAAAGMLMGCPEPTNQSDAGVDGGGNVPPITDGGGGDAGHDAGTTAVTGSRVNTHWTTTGSSQAPEDLTDDTIVAHVFNTQTNAFDSIVGVGTSAGTFSIPVVPEDEYYLQFNRSFVHTDAHVVNLGTELLGRPNVPLADAGTLLTLSLTNLEPWGEYDDLMIVSPNAGLDYFDTYFYDFAAISGGPGQNDTTTNAWTFDYEYALGPDAVLVNGAAGDTLHILQLETQVADGGVFQVGASRYFETTQVNMQGGADNIITGALMPISQTTIQPVDFRASEFEALVSQLPPDSSARGSSIYVDAQPFKPGTGSGAADLARFDAPPGTGNHNVQLQFGNPFPATYFPRIAPVVYFFVEQSLSLPDGGTVSRSTGTNAGWVDTLSAGAAAPLQPRLGPPRDVQINGQSTAQNVTGVGVTPSMSWTLPSLGTATSYSVTFFEVAVNASGTSLVNRGVVGTILTANTSVRVPPGLLSSGKHYYARILARSEPGAPSVKTQPYASSNPYAYAGTVTKLITP